MDTNILIVGAGVSGLSLAYFLEKEGISDIVIIDKKQQIGVPVKDTGLVSDALLYLIPYARKCVLTTFKKAILCYNRDYFDITTLKRNMLLLDRELLDKLIYNNLEHTQVILNTSLIKIERSYNTAITTKGKIRYNIIIDASGPFGVVRKFYNLPNSGFVVGMECGLETSKVNKKIQIFLDKKYSSKYFGWVLQYSNKVKVGLIDKDLKYERFLKFIRNLGYSKYKWFYADIIKNYPERKIVSNNMLCIGESSGYLKQFSLGGIVFGVLQAKIASQVITQFLEKNIDLEVYEHIVKKLFWKGNLVSNLIRNLLKSKCIFKLVKLSKINKISKYLDLDTYLPMDLRKVTF